MLGLFAETKPGFLMWILDDNFMPISINILFGFRCIGNNIF